MTKVFKLLGECYEINESPSVYKTIDSAIISISEWEDFLGMSKEEALESGEVWVVEWILHD